ncbi:sorting nexin-14-like isoform X1 [Neodiprion virginianus]|uniref:sorting nexin-14-like isoform X1 n=1 Tax=Neodiprion virginianus TaxID=2961670 RepID=UPI001EE732B8|nr:sorting nexin-14-like isoform X1 [Neodiprion virginianus]
MIFLSGDKIECSLALIALTFAVFLGVFDSITWIAAISAVYFIGVLWGTSFLQYVGFNLKKLHYVSNLKTGNDESCGVCGGDVCKRHRPSRNLARINVPKDFDDALENLLEQLLQTYICTWYLEFSSDEAFVQQFRTCIATAAGNIAQRLFRVDTAAVIFDHLVPIALQHAQDWKVLVNRAKAEGGNPADYVADFLGPRIHPAAYSREAELNYLRGLVTTLMPLLLPTTHLSINNKIILREILANWVLLPAMDALADPDNINTLVVLSTHHEGEFTQTADSVNVPLLHSWAMPPLLVDNVPNTLKPSLEEILNNPQLLYLFMQHIKEIGHVHLLQFCLDIDDLSKRLLNPDITVETEENLYAVAQNLYSSYLTLDTPNYLHLPVHISKGLQKILEGGPSKIQELRTSRPLYQAHQEAHTILEITCLPSFHHSYQIYTLLCGQQTPSTHPKSMNQHNQGGPVGMGSRFSNQIGRIQRVLRTSAVDGAPYQQENVYQAEEVDCTPRLHPISNSYEDGGDRDLTTWRVTVPHVDGGGAQPLYMIAVHSVAQEKSWTVLRRDIDFYSLRTRLAEFHGDRELNDSPLPARKNQHPSLNTNRQRYQDFLQKLLAKPKLRSSELLHTFLTAPNLEPYYSSYSTPDIGLFYQNVAHKLRKERGQHLDKFMKTFLSSINMKDEYADVGVEPSSEHSLSISQRKGRDLVHVGPFGNNLDLPPKLQDFQFVFTNQPQHVKGACFCIVEAVNNLLEVPPSLAQAYWLAASLSYQSLDPLINKLMNKTLVKLLSSGRAAVVVKLLHTTILGPKSNDKELSSLGDFETKKLEQAQAGLSSLIPWWIIGLHTTWHKLMRSLLEPLQNPAFNKHLAYCLLDQIIADLFPEISS